MERRRDFRHLLRCPIQVECERTARVLEGLVTRDVSASGLSFLHAEAARVLAPAGVDIGVERFAPDSANQPNLPGGAHLTAREWARFGEFVRTGGGSTRDGAFPRRPA